MTKRGQVVVNLDGGRGTPTERAQRMLAIIDREPPKRWPVRVRNDQPREEAKRAWDYAGDKGRPSEA